MRHLFLSLVLATPVAMAQNSLSLPSPPSWPSGSDRIKGSDGTSCESSVAPRNAFADFGVMASRGNGIGNSNSGIVIKNDSRFIDNGFRRDGVSVYFRVIINLDKAKPVIDCSQLYQLEIERLKAEIEFLQMGGASVAGGIPD